MTNFPGQDENDEHDVRFNAEIASPEFLKLLEATILAAGKYVIPSDNLRPYTLEAAREQSSDRQVNHRFAKLFVAIAVCGTLSIPVLSQLSSWRGKVSSPTSYDLHEIARRKNIGMDWGLYEAFGEMRKSQASGFGNSR